MQIYKASSSSSVKFDHPFLISLISQLYVEEVEILGKFIIGVGQTFPINIQISLWRNLGRHKHWLKSIFNISQINWKGMKFESGHTYSFGNQKIKTLFFFLNDAMF